MTSTQFTSRDFNRDAGGAKRAAENGPVFITDRGRPAHVLLTIDDYRRLADGEGDIAELLSRPQGVGDIDFDPPRSRETATPATFD
jgi:prevent-host-death family protein